MLTAIKGESESNTIIIGDSNTPLSPMDRSSKMKINKETQALNDSLNKVDLIDIYRTFHPKTLLYMQNSIINYSHHAVHYILMTYLFCNWQFLHFDLLHSNCPPPSVKHWYVLWIYEPDILVWFCLYLFICLFIFQI